MSDTQTTIEPATAEPLSFSDRAVQMCPYAAYDKLRDNTPVYKDPITGHYVLTRYADVRKALLNHRDLSNNANMLGRRQTPATEQIARMYEEKGWPLADSIQLMDEPRHRAKRALIDKAFSYWSIQTLSSYIAATVNDLIDRFIDQGECEFVSAFAVRLTMRVIADQLGVRHADPEQFDRDAARLQLWSDYAIETISPTITPEREIELALHNLDFQHFCVANISRLVDAPDETLLSKLIEVVRDENGDPDIPELLILMRTVLVAGNETTRFSLASAMKMLIDRPELPNELRGNEARIELFVEEVLRLMTPIQTLFRLAKTDVTIGDTIVPAGSRVEVRYGAANRDPEAFEEPEELDLDRGGRAHLAFGIGIHSCVGMGLAREEIRLAVRILLDRLDNFRFARADDSFAYNAMYISYGLARLNIAFDRRDGRRA